MSKNAFETGERKLIPAVLIYVFRGDEVLLIHRNQKKEDYHSGKWNGLGGKLEADESPQQGAQRELLEESGLNLTIKDFRVLGTILFPNFKPHRGEDWLVYLFRADLNDESVKTSIKGHSCEEGDLEWVRISEVLTLPLWEGDREFLPHMFAAQPVLGTIWYQGEKVLRSHIDLLSREI